MAGVRFWRNGLGEVGRNGVRIHELELSCAVPHPDREDLLNTYT